MKGTTVKFFNRDRLLMGLATITVLGVMFQIGHFAEHAWQWGEWLFGARDKPWMSPLANWLSMRAGELVYPIPVDCGDLTRWCKEQMTRGMEVLHLAGNLIFLATLIAMSVIVRMDRLYRYSGAKYLNYAVVWEGLHLLEHLALTITVLQTGKAIGVSNLLGSAGAVLGPDNAVGYRVTWHFLMNFGPTVLLMLFFTKPAVPKLQRRVIFDWSAA